jgi:uncharacterized membrane protein
MAIQLISWIFAIPLLGFATGLRTMTPMAIVCWFARLGYLPVKGTWAAWTGHTASVAVFTLLALGEFVGDKLPTTPNRTATFPLLSRVAFGGLAGAIAATAMRGPGLEGTLLGLCGAVVGTYAGFMVRRASVKKIACPDWPIAVAEDLFTVLCAFFAMHVITN